MYCRGVFALLCFMLTSCDDSRSRVDAGSGADTGGERDADEGTDACVSCPTSGALRWSHEIHPVARTPEFNFVSADLPGRVIVADSEALRAFDDSGTPLWTTERPAPVSALGLAADDAGSVFVVGSFYDSYDLLYRPWVATLGPSTGQLGPDILPYRDKSTLLNLIRRAHDRVGPGIVVSDGTLEATGGLVLLDGTGAFVNGVRFTTQSVADIDVMGDTIAAVLRSSTGSAIQFTTLDLEPLGFVEYPGENIWRVRLLDDSSFVWAGASSEGPTAVRGSLTTSRQWSFVPAGVAGRLAALALHDGAVFVGGGNGYVARVSLEDGTEQWRDTSDDPTAETREIAARDPLGVTAAVAHTPAEISPYYELRTFVP